MIVQGADRSKIKEAGRETSQIMEGVNYPAGAARKIAHQGAVMNKSNRSITGIAEIALRVHDLDRMRKFYEQVIGLEVLREIKESDGAIIFYSVGAGNDHLALFEEKWMDWFTRDKSPQIDPKLTTLSHFAMRIALEDFESEKKRLEQLGIEIVHTNESSWLHCRMFYFFDPEGNLIEFNSHDASV